MMMDEDRAGLFFMAAVSVLYDTRWSAAERDAVLDALRPLYKVPATDEDRKWATDVCLALFGEDGSRNTVEQVFGPA
jgi:hypothetical protein